MGRWLLWVVCVMGCSPSPGAPPTQPNSAPAVRAQSRTVKPNELPPPSSVRSVQSSPEDSISSPPTEVAPKVVPIQEPFGESYPPPISSNAPFGKVGSLTWGTWIHPKPDSRSLPLGGIRPGSTLPLVDDERVSGLGKCRQFVKVNHGYVCATRRGTLNMDSVWLQANRWTEPAPGIFPYEYALSVGAPMLTRIPEPDENRWKVGRRDIAPIKGWAAGHDELAEDEPIQANGPIPEILEQGASLPTPWGNKPHLFFKKIPFGSMLAYTRAFEAGGEVWVLSTNLTVVPASGLKRFRRSKFQGVELEGELELPIAWMRKKPRPKWHRTESGFEKTGEYWPLRGWVGLTGRQVKQGDRTYLETKEKNYIEKSEATLAEAREKLPWEIKGDAKWIHVRVRRGTLTLYEGARPIFTTLMSPGKEGATPYGRYRIESKHHVTTMTTEMGEPKKFWVADVPWTMYFKRPYAIHGAYWHEDFGEKKSGGCINLSLTDAKRVFDWTDPPLPEGWGTVQGYGMGGGTFILVEG